MKMCTLPRRLLPGEGTRDHVAAVAERKEQGTTPVPQPARTRKGSANRQGPRTGGSQPGKRSKETIKNADAQILVRSEHLRFKSRSKTGS